MNKNVVAAGLFVGAVVLQFAMISVFNRIGHQVQAALPPGNEIPSWGPSWLRGRILKLHRTLYPKSSLRRKLYTLWVVQAVIFLAAIALVVRFV